MLLFLIVSICSIGILAIGLHLRLLAMERKETKQERQRRQVYEKALALPFWDERELQREIWNRAARGDELAEDILQEMFWDDVSSQNRQKSFSAKKK